MLPAFLASGPHLPMTPLVILLVALAEERRALQACLLRGCGGMLDDRPLVQGRLADRDVLLLQGGIGRARARASVLAASRRFRLQAVWSLGFAGGLADRLRPGDLIYPVSLLDQAAPEAPHLPLAAHHAVVCAALQGASLSVDTGPLLTVDAPLQTPEAKRAAHRMTGAVAVDMEAAGVAAAAQELGIPWTALKVIVDAAGTPLAPVLTKCTTPRGDLDRAGLLAASLGGRPAWRALIRMGWASRRAGRNLRRGLETSFGTWTALTPLGVSSTM
jgi:adenosylhomocysteine nucleosidase